jgi:hypothetical protein
VSERWLTSKEACETIGARLKASVGLSEAILIDARTSREVRTQEPSFMNDDAPGILRNAQIGERKFSADDLLDWLDRKHPLTTEPATVASARYPGDAALIEEGRRMLAGGKQKRAIARELAERAEGAGTFESKVDRLRRLL